MPTPPAFDSGIRNSWQDFHAIRLWLRDALRRRWRSGYSRAVTMRDVAVIVMAKLPQAGKVKTRLCPPLTQQQAADVHRVFLRHLISQLHRLRPGELIICHHPPEAAMEMRQLLEPAGQPALMPQHGTGLGARIEFAAERARHRHRRLLFFGADSPDLPQSHLLAAADLTGKADVTVGPTVDGGYWCLGVGDRVDVGQLLDGVEWSSGREAQQTMDRSRRLGYSLSQAPPWDDVDHPQDLRRLLVRLCASADEEDRRLYNRLAGLNLRLPQT